MAMAAISNPFLLLPRSSPQFPCKPTTRLRPSTFGSTTSLLRASSKPPTKDEARREAEVEELAHVLMRKAGDEKDLLVSLNKYLKVIRTEHCLRLFEELGKRDKWLHCLEVVRWMQQQRWYVADSDTYSRMISVVGSKGQTRMAMWLFSEMLNRRCRPDTSVYNALIETHLHSNNRVRVLSKASSYFKKMKEMESCQPNIATYNILMRAYALARDLQQVELLFKELEENSILPNICTYNGLMDGYGKNGMIEEMESLLLQMASRKCKPDGATFNILIDTYGKKQMFNKMEQSFEDLLHSTESPTASTFNSMILSYGEAKQMEKVESIYSKMNDLGFKPGLITFESLITAYGYCGCVAKARAVVDELMESDGKTDTSILNAMFEAYCKNGLRKDADELLDLATEYGFQPTISTYKILYRAYTNGYERNLLRKLRKRMMNEGVRPDLDFHMHVLQDVWSAQQAKAGEESEHSEESAARSSRAVEEILSQIPLSRIAGIS